MVTTEILQLLHHSTGRFEAAAVRDALFHRQIVPQLIDIVESAGELCARYPDRGDYTAHLYAFFILTELQEVRAHVPLLRLCVRPYRQVGFLFGDFLDEELARALAATSGGDLAGLSLMIQDSLIHPKVRVAAIQALVRIAVAADAPRRNVIQCLRQLFRQVERKRSSVWSELVNAAMELAAEDLKVPVLIAIETGLVWHKWRDVKPLLEGQWHINRLVLRDVYRMKPDRSGDGWWNPHYRPQQ